MKKLSLAIMALGVAASSQAFVNFNLDSQYLSVAQPISGSTLVTFTGTVDILNPLYDATNAFGDLPGLTPAGPYLGGTFNAAFVAYVNGTNFGIDYSGPIVEITVQSTDALGNYWFNSSNASTLAELFVTVSDGTNIATDNEFYGVTVTAVPEPASMAALGLGVLALIRRRKA